jgi:hypothetical protein
VAVQSNRAKDLSLLFDASPMTHPHVADAYHQAASKLANAGIKFRPMGGTAMWLVGAGRPTKDVDLIVARRNWHKARAVLQELATDPLGIHFGLRGEPEQGLALVGPHGVAIEVWPAGITHGTIARIRGVARKHPAGRLKLTLAGNDRIALLNSKLASYLSASDRLRDAADVQALISKWELSLIFSSRLSPAVRAAYERIWRGQV